MSRATCRECGAAFDRAPGQPRACSPECVEALKRRIVKQGTPIPTYRYPEEVLGDDEAGRRIKRLARRAAALSTASPSPRDDRKKKPEQEADRKAQAAEALAKLDAALQAEGAGRLRYWMQAWMIDGHFSGATGQGGVWAAASRLVNNAARREVQRRGQAWREAGLGSFATEEAVREAGLGWTL